MRDIWGKFGDDQAMNFCFILTFSDYPKQNLNIHNEKIRRKRTPCLIPLVGSNQSKLLPLVRVEIIGENFEYVFFLYIHVYIFSLNFAYVVPSYSFASFLVEEFGISPPPPHEPRAFSSLAPPYFLQIEIII